MRLFSILIVLPVASATFYDSATFQPHVRLDGKPATVPYAGNTLERRSTVVRNKARNFKRGNCFGKCARKSRPTLSSPGRKPPSHLAQEAQSPSSRHVQSIESESNRVGRAALSPILTPKVSGLSGAGGSSQRSESPQVVPDAPAGSRLELPVVYTRIQSSSFIERSLEL
ncbi:MAG: hypothetical protein GOMPHAMPRED_008110 [Gomphillus americanus]|uniref:Uncharacterized protein n=1 Tax=Gomphillus americanus TaxID=1940652 RepID=A0A8H3F4L9_9LECA|nr:MAG: hypothetical protein GOMPHAMPRED_008110 [Gomphillus americanus]